MNPTHTAPLAQCPVLKNCTQSGKQSIKNTHKEMFPSGKYILLSTDFEQAAMTWKSQLKRCDYLVLSARLDQWVAVEVHQANAKELKQKRQDTKAILEKHCPPMNAVIKRFFVCAVGGIHPTQRKLLADSDISISRDLRDFL
jgi:Zn-dependent M32 family carboxypeptidase